MRNAKTIGIDARMLGPEQTGIGKYIARLLEYVPPLLPNIRFVVFLREPEFSRFQIRHANVDKIKVSAHWYGYAEQLKFPFQLLAADVDLMHFPHFNVPLLYPRKFIVTIHDLTPQSFPGPNMTSPWRKQMFQWVFASALKRARRILAVSNYTKVHMMRHFHTEAEKIQVLYEGIDPVFFERPPTPNSAEILNTYKINKPYLLYVGVWRNHKNLVGLIEAYAKLLPKFPSLNLVLCGKEDPRYPEVRKTWEKLGLSEKIIRPGFVPEKDLPHLYREASLTVVPSFAEGFGFTGLESLASGTPTAASRVTSLPEILGESAFYFDPHSPDDMAHTISRALLDEAARKVSLEAFQANRAQFSWQHMAKEIAQIYTELLS